MGILSDPEKRKKIVAAIAKYNNLICILCYVVGVGWFFALAYKPLNAGNYFSENALLPGNISEFLLVDPSDRGMNLNTGCSLSHHRLL